MKKNIRYILAFILTAFGLLTLFLSGSVIFDLFGIREMEGNYVPFIVWANFVSSIIYLVAVYGIIKSKKWSFYVLGVSFLILFFSFIALQLYIDAGGIHEAKTVKAMIFRSTLTAVFALGAYYSINKKENLST